jgi:hypothetical protein
VVAKAAAIRAARSLFISYTFRKFLKTSSNSEAHAKRAAASVG